MEGLIRQIAAFAGAGLAAAIAHYGALIALVQGSGMKAVPASLAGYVLGGLVSYALNRRHTYESARPHAEAGWRFAAVAFVGFLLTALFMHILAERAGLHYLPAQILTTLIVMAWSFVAHKFWTFGAGA